MATKNGGDKEEDVWKHSSEVIEGIDFVDYHDERQLESVMNLVGRDLSEPYSSKACIFLPLSIEAPAIT